MPEQSVPHRIGGPSHRRVVLLDGRNRLNPADANDQLWKSVAERLTFLAIKENQRVFGRKLPEDMVHEGSLSSAAKYPGTGERRLFVRRQRNREPRVDVRLFAPEHPAEWHRKGRIFRNLDHRRPQRSVRFSRLLDLRIGVLEAPHPRPFIHKGSGLSLARRQLLLVEVSPAYARNFVERIVILLLSDTV